jgi:uncharacterized protein (DUF433 family)
VLVPSRIEINPAVMLGKPVIRGTRVPVELLLRKLAEGAAETDLLDAYPGIEIEDLRAAVAFGAQLVAREWRVRWNPDIPAGDPRRWRIVFVRPLSGFRLEVKFVDGVQGIVDLSGRLWCPVFEPLQEPERFAEVSLDEHGVICWPNGADLAPDAIYEDLTSGSSAAR